jgi:dihydrolipoamide dehydrogenase
LHGIYADNARIEIGEFIARKDKIVRQFTNGISQLFKGNNISSYFGRGHLTRNNEVTVDAFDGQTHTLAGTDIIIATGSVPYELPSARFDGQYIVDNEGALDFTEVPGRLGVIGAGVVGLELGSVWNRLGAEVTILEAQTEFLANADADLGKVALREFKKQGLSIKLGASLASATVVNNAVHIVFSDAEGDHQIVVDKLLVAVGRRAFTESLFDEDVEVKLDERGRVIVDDDCRTTAPHVWAIGDVVRGPMLAHKGSEEGIAVAERIAGKSGHVDFNTLPWVIYTEPEIAWVGKSEKQLLAEGTPYKIGTFPFAAIGRAVAMNAATGHVKVLAHPQTDRILGVHMVGPGVSELIAEAVLAMEFRGSSEDIGLIAHAHPSLSEATREAALAVSGRAITKINT